MIVKMNSLKASDRIDIKVIEGASEYIAKSPEKRSHAADPVKKINDINEISSYYLARGKYRDNLLWVCGINLGMRCSDLLKLQVGDIINESGYFNDSIILEEQKTKKVRKFFINEAIREAFSLMYVGKEVELGDYLFKSESNNSKGKNRPMTRYGASLVLKEAMEALEIDIHSGTHCMRKTFVYQGIMNAPDRSRALEFMQQVLGHSSQAITLRYAGITEDEVKSMYEGLNLGISSLAAAAEDEGNKVQSAS